MEERILVGTVGGLWELAGGRASREAHAGRTVTALAQDGVRTWAIIDGKALAVTEAERGWATIASIDGPPATCVAPSSAGVLVGTAEGHLKQLEGRRLVSVESFDTVAGRDAWYTPWGDPADVRSIAVGRDTLGTASTIYVNVHVGGVVRSRDGGRSWSPTIDIDADVHQVITLPGDPRVVLVAAYEGLGISRDGGESWEFSTAGMHAHYCRAVAVAHDAVVVSASTGPRGTRATLYRRPLVGRTEFERCRTGLPTWFDDNIDTGCLAASRSLVVAGTEDGRVFQSRDSGLSWDLLAQGLPAVRSIVIG